jgi:hypothetical protein
MTTTQIKRTYPAHVFGSTVSVVTGTPALTDSANGFTQLDVGSSVTTLNTAGRKVSSVTNAGAAVMDGNATASSGPQACTLTPALVNVTRKPVSQTDKTGPLLVQLTSGQSTMVQFALNMWTNCGGVGTAATRAQKVLAASGIFVQET